MLNQELLEVKKYREEVKRDYVFPEYRIDLIRKITGEV